MVTLFVIPLEFLSRCNLVEFIKAASLIFVSIILLDYYLGQDLDFYSLVYSFIIISLIFACMQKATKRLWVWKDSY